LTVFGHKYSGGHGTFRLLEWLTSNSPALFPHI
jgi:hypothetical protein